MTAAEGQRTLTFASGKTVDVYSSRFMLAAIDYCFRNISHTFYDVRTRYAGTDLGTEAKKQAVQSLKDDMAHLLANQNLLRRNILNQLRYLAENDAIPDALTWAQGMVASKTQVARSAAPAQARPGFSRPVAATASLQ